MIHSFIKYLIVFATAFIVTFIMDMNGFSFVSQCVAAGVIGLFLGMVDVRTEAHDADKET